jgi:hypothetical protein
MSTHKAIKIDVQALTVSTVEISDLPDIYRELGEGVSCFDCVRFKDNSSDVLYVDDEGMMKEQERFIVCCDLPYTVLAGNALLVGTDAEGGSIDPKRTVMELANSMFVCSKFVALQMMLKCAVSDRADQMVDESKLSVEELDQMQAQQIKDQDKLLSMEIMLLTCEPEERAELTFIEELRVA